MKPTKSIAFISLFGCTAFVVIVCLLHFLRPDKNRLSCFVSEYAVGNYGWLMTLAFYTLAIAAALLLIGLLQGYKASATACITFGIFSVGILLAGIFPTDVPVEPPTTRGLILGFAALIALLNLGISMIAWGNVFKKNENWKSFAKPSIFYGVVSLVLLIIFVGSPILFRGLTQRILLGWDISWLLLVSWKLYHNPAGVATSINTSQ
jgi:uncharacterized membrane protein YidH (DUF202 family)